MRTASVTIGTLLVGAAVALVNCGGDDTSPTGGTGATGGSGGSTGGSGGATTGGKGGSTGGSAGSGGASGAGTQDSGADQSSGGSAGTAGTAGSGGKAGSAGAAGSGGKAGSSGAGGSAGNAGSAGSGGKAGSAGGGMDASSDAQGCPQMQPMPNTDCDVTSDCHYGPVTCTCIDPGPTGNWVCTGGPPPEGGGGGDGSGGTCPAVEPNFGDPCADSGSLGPCFYDSGHSECVCDPTGVGWSCIRH